MAYRFEDKFIHFRWDDSLKGKKVFYADSISCLEEDVAKGEDYKLLIGASENKMYPFLISGSEELSDTNWKFVYYDPNYEVKLAYEEGKQIQYKAKDTGNWCDWENYLGKCSFCNDVEYRIKSEINAMENMPTWAETNKYRIKPNGLKWTDLNVGDIIETFTERHCKEMVTRIDFDDDGLGKHIYVSNSWIADVDLKDWRKVKNV